MHIEVYNSGADKVGHWKWRIVSGNGKAIAWSGFYQKRSNANDSAKVVGKKGKMKVVICQ